MSRRKLERRTTNMIDQHSRQPSPVGMIGDSAVPVVFSAAIDRIRPNPDQPRKHFSKEGIATLAASIQEKGLKQPILVTPDETGEEYYIIAAGERRWRAHVYLGLTYIPAIKVTGSIDEIALLENMQREDLTPVETARAIERLHQGHGYSHDSLAALAGISKTEVTRLLTVARLPSEILDEYHLLETKERPSKSAMMEVAAAPDANTWTMWEHAKGGLPVIALRQFRENLAAQDAVPEHAIFSGDDTAKYSDDRSRDESEQKVMIRRTIMVRRRLSTMFKGISDIAERPELLGEEERRRLREMRRAIDELLKR